MTVEQKLNELKHHHDNKEPELQVTLKDDSKGVEGYIVVWDSAPGEKGPLGACAKGGTRILPDLSVDVVRMLASKMALKNAAAGLPLGGAKSGLKADSNDPETEYKYKEFAKMSKPYLHENGGVFGGFGFDIGARKEHPYWVCEALGSLKSFTGKPIDMGGTDYDVEGIAGLGVAVAGREATQHLGLVDKTYSVQGVGAMGAAVIRYFQNMGGSLRFISDPRLGGSWQLDEGKLSDEFFHYIKDHNIAEVHKILKADHLFLSEDSNEALYQPVDLIYPCAVQNVITKENVNKLQTKLVVEGANSPVSFDAYSLLKDKKIYAAPDFMVNSGGVIAAFVEMTDGTSPEENARTKVKTKEAKRLTEEKIAKNMHDFFACIKETNFSSHEAAYYIALSRLYS